MGKHAASKAVELLVEQVRDHEMEIDGSEIEVDLEDLKTLLTWAQNKLGLTELTVGDRVKVGKGFVPGSGTVVSGSIYRDEVRIVRGDKGTVYQTFGKGLNVRVQFDTAPEGNPVYMYLDELRKL